MKRITADEVVEAYRKRPWFKPETGMAGRFTIGESDEWDCGGCAMGVLWLDDQNLTLESGVRTCIASYDWANRKYGVSYMDGFHDGFDQIHNRETSDEQTAVGYADGLAARRAVEAVYGPL
jgi:hypothetical protein